MHLKRWNNASLQKVSVIAIASAKLLENFIRIELLEWLLIVYLILSFLPLYVQRSSKTVQLCLYWGNDKLRHQALVKLKITILIHGDFICEGCMYLCIRLFMLINFDWINNNCNLNNNRRVIYLKSRLFCHIPDKYSLGKQTLFR